MASSIDSVLPNDEIGAPAHDPSVGIVERQGMVWVPGRTFLMGSDCHYPEEAPAHQVMVSGFWMDETAVTNAQFARFVASTGYVTVAERPLDPREYPGADPSMLVPGALVFRKRRGPVDLRDFRNWWAYVPGACWRSPQGPGSSIDGLGDWPSSKSPSRTRQPTPNGPGRRCRPRQSGSSRPEEDSREQSSFGETSSLLKEDISRIHGKASFRGRTSAPTGSKALPP